MTIPVEDFKKIKMKGRGKESAFQQAAVKWFRLQYPQYATLLFSIPNQGQRSARNGARMKAEGMTKGVLDLFLAVPRGTFHGMWIELKTEDGRLTKEQATMSLDLSNQDFHVAVCRSFSEFQNHVNCYLEP